MSFNQDYQDALIVRQLLLNRVANHLASRVEKEYLRQIKDIITHIKQHDMINHTNFKKVIKSVEKLLNIDIDFMKAELSDLALHEVEYTVKKANTIADYPLFNNIPSDKSIASIFTTSLMSAGDRAETIPNWYKMLDKSMMQKIEGSIKLGVSQEETTHEIAKRIKLITKRTVSDAKGLALTAISQVTHDAREKVYNANSDVIKGWVSVGILDSRTSFICAGYDGATYDFKTHKWLNAKGKTHPYYPPPRHVWCRSVHSIITKSYKELGLDIDEISGLTRSSMDGYVPKDMSFDDWIKTKTPKQQKKYFGKGRYELFKDGKITVSDLVGQNGRTLTLEELKAKG